MAAKNTVNIQKMKSAAAELDNIYTSMQKQIKTLDETISAVRKIWTGDAANTYLKQYEKNLNSFKSMANAIRSASEALGDSCNTYDQAEGSALDIVAKMGKR
ncbi:MAG: WXG100 family type VII secretion target [Lachnospiraceae bacterium]|nr:WXG100 family type VII secretion target [Lachnospiraceae bacterium]